MSHLDLSQAGLRRPQQPGNVPWGTRLPLQPNPISCLESTSSFLITGPWEEGPEGHMSQWSESPKQGGGCLQDGPGEKIYLAESYDISII